MMSKLRFHINLGRHALCRGSRWQQEGGKQRFAAFAQSRTPTTCSLSTACFHKQRMTSLLSSNTTPSVALRWSHRYFSSTRGSAVSSRSLRNFVKPFMLRCHPDVQTAEDAKQVNLRAIQNLNAYLDSMERLASGVPGYRISQDEQVVEIDFIISVQERYTARKKEITSASRRKVHLTWPHPDLLDYPSALLEHTHYELAKLLRVAGLEVPAELQTARSSNLSDVANHDDYSYYGGADDEDRSLDTWDHVWQEAMDLNLDGPPPGREGGHHHQRHRPQSIYARMDASRRRFTRRIDWDKVDRLYHKAWQEAQADMATRGLIRNHREQRLKFIADILSRVVPDPEIDILSRFCAMRRLSLLLDEHFDRLQLEDSSAMWEIVTIRLTGERPYNTSSTALYKRRLQQAENGFAFTLHANGTISIEIPLDFREEELLQEWDRNLWDFYDMVDDELDDIFVDPKQTWV